LRCESCGHENLHGGIYCENCGAIVAGQARPDDPVLNGPKETIRSAVSEREQLDRMLPPWIVWVNVLLSFGAAIGTVAYVFSAFSYESLDLEEYWRSMATAYAMVFCISIVSQLIFATISYYLIDRHNDHAAREGRLKNGIIRLAQAAATSPESQSAVTRELQSISLYESSGTRTRSPALWAFLIATPAIGALLSLVLMVIALENFSVSAFLGAIGTGSLLGLVGFVATIYMFYFLMKEENAHENSWTGFLLDSSRVLTRLGFPIARNLAPRSPPDRSFALYLVLTIFTGIFVYYWWYTLIKDPNDHYKDQWMAEDSILRAIGR